VGNPVYPVHGIETRTGRRIVVAEHLEREPVVVRTSAAL
jgi:hypothetical protein